MSNCGMVRSLLYSVDRLGGKDSERLIRWFLIHRTTGRLRYVARCLDASDISDIVQDVYVKLLSGKSPPAGLLLSTVVCKSALWTLLRVGCRSRTREHRCKLRPREELRDIAVDSGDDLIEQQARLSLRESIDRLLITLSYRKRLVIEMRYGLGDGVQYSLSEVGRVLGLSRARVHQIELDAIKKLQHPDRSRFLAGFHRDLSYRLPD